MIDYGKPRKATKETKLTNEPQGMDILSCIEIGNGIGYRKAKESQHRGSNGKGWIDIRCFLENNRIAEQSGNSLQNLRLTWDDLTANDWVPYVP